MLPSCLSVVLVHVDMYKFNRYQFDLKTPICVTPIVILLYRFMS